MTEPTANLPPELTGRLLSLMEQLLLEVTATETSTAEGSNEQDHA
jgi:ABC-type histidine transport system ATPase subunit